MMSDANEMNDDLSFRKTAFCLKTVREDLNTPSNFILISNRISILKQ